MSKECLSQTLKEVREGPLGTLEDKFLAEVKSKVSAPEAEVSLANDLRGWNKVRESKLGGPQRGSGGWGCRTFPAMIKL